MASVLIVGNAPVLRELVRDLTMLTNHSPIVVLDALTPLTGAARRAGDALLLDADLPMTARNAWTRHAADLRAVIVYYASSMSESELHTFADWRNAPFFALPNGPRRLGAILDHALAMRATQESERSSDAIKKLQGALHARLGLLAMLAQARARVVIEDAVAARTRSRQLRGERDSMLTQVRARRDGLRDSVTMMAIAMRKAGASPERSLVLMRDAVTRRNGVPTEDPGGVSVEAETDRWVLEAYSAA
ncbi:MAG TPA: hypothetical protein VGG84_01745 [Gemmatimonadaceae bacterium]